MIDEIYERSPADQQIGLFRRSWWRDLRRHQELYPDSPKRREMIVAIIGGALMMFAGVCLLLDWNSLCELNRSRVVAPRQQAVRVTLADGEPAGHNTYRYRYVFSLGGSSYEGSEYSAPESPTRIGQQITVYYDPIDPRVNSPKPFEYSGRQRIERAWNYAVGLNLILFLLVETFVSILIARGWPNRCAHTTEGYGS